MREGSLEAPTRHRIAWEDPEQKVWIAYNDPAFVRDRYNLPAAISSPLNLDPMVTKALE